MLKVLRNWTQGVMEHWRFFGQQVLKVASSFSCSSCRTNPSAKKPVMVGLGSPLMELSLIPVPQGDPSSRQKAPGRNDASSAGTTKKGPLSGTCWRLDAGAEDGLELVQLLSRESPAIDAACHIPPLPE